MAVVPKKPAARKPRAPVRPGGLAHGRWLGDFPDLSAAELRLVACCARGEAWEPDRWDRKRPTEKSEANTIRADLIRFLALGGDDRHPVHEQGVMVDGAWIMGVLNLHQCRATLGLSLNYCHFDSEPNLSSARLPQLTLIGSLVPSLRADRLIVTGSILLRSGFSSKGEIRLLGAEIGGNLVCIKGEFTNHGKRVLGADRIKVAGSIFLRDATINGTIHLNAAHIGGLNDNSECWLAGGHILNGLQYDRIIGPTDAASRIAWLNSQEPDHLNEKTWKPQPWEQLIKVLREMGHGYEAGEVAMAKQDHMRKAGIIRGPLRRGFHWLYGLLAGYGHRPVRTVAAMLTVWLACAFFFQIGGSYGYVGPGTPLLNNADLAPDVAKQCGHRFETGKTVWTRCPAMPAEYTTFQPLLYSLDLILPLVDLQQDTDWAPIVEDPPGTNLGFGVFLRWLMWFEILFGWAMSLMLVAVLGRLVEKD